MAKKRGKGQARHGNNGFTNLVASFCRFLRFYSLFCLIFSYFFAFCFISNPFTWFVFGILFYIFSILIRTWLKYLLYRDSFIYLLYLLFYILNRAVYLLIFSVCLLFLVFCCSILIRGLLLESLTLLKSLFFYLPTISSN